MTTSATAAGTRAPGGRRRALVGLVVLLVVVVGAGIAWWSGRDDRPRAEPGRLIAGVGDDGIRGGSAEMAIPWATLTVTVSDPMDELPDSADAGPEGLRAPRDGSFVGISVSIAEPTGVPAITSSAATYSRPDLALVADGRRYRLGDLSAAMVTATGEANWGKRARYLAVAGSPRAVQLEVGYLGKRGLLGVNGGANELGRFAELGKMPAVYRSTDCGAMTLPAGFAFDSPPRCSIEAVRVPYIGAVGWAADGKDWLAVTPGISAPARIGWTSPTGRRTSYRLTDLVTDEYRIGGARPAGLLNVQELRRQVVANVSKGPQTFTVARKVIVRRDGGDVSGAPDQVELAVSWRFTIP